MRALTGLIGVLLFEVAQLGRELDQHRRLALGVREAVALQLLVHKVLQEVLFFSLTHPLHHLQETNGEKDMKPTVGHTSDEELDQCRNSRFDV